ncbi:MAG: integrin alpha [Planctomycetaceae bacterium]
MLTGPSRRFQKISDTQGSFTALLNDTDHFGASVVSLGDLDGDGVTDIAVGARLDDDGGSDRGSVYVLFMNTNGGVRRSRRSVTPSAASPARWMTGTRSETNWQPSATWTGTESTTSQSLRTQTMTAAPTEVQSTCSS